MNTRLREYVDTLFEGKPLNNKNAALKEEMLANMNEKYEDLIREGYGEDKAFYKVASGVGDIRRVSGKKKKMGKLPKIKAKKEKLSSDVFLCGSKRDKEIYKSVRSSYWIIILIIYLISSFTFDNWDTSWVIFLFGLSLENMILFGLIRRRNSWRRGIIDMRGNNREPLDEDPSFKEKIHKREKQCITIAIFSLTTAIYIVYSFFSDAWSITWVIFLFALLVKNFVNLHYKINR